MLALIAEREQFRSLSAAKVRIYFHIKRGSPYFLIYIKAKAGEDVLFCHPRPPESLPPTNPPLRHLRECAPLEILLALGNPPATVNLHVLVEVAHGVNGQFVLLETFGTSVSFRRRATVLLCHQRSQGVAGVWCPALVGSAERLYSALL